MSQKHKLAAIVFTDIVGYTQQMDADEQQTMKLLERQKQIVYPIVESYNGQILKEIGDGLLMMFDSAIQAVRCVIAFQKELKNEEFSVRAGIHIGDIIFKDGDVFGSAVNIAARIEPLAQPNGICVSGSVTNQLRNQKDIFLRGIGEKELKGVSEPVKIYEVLMEAPEQREMPKLSFWQHLWRRRIPQVFGTYIVGSAIIMFVINWLINQYSLSPYLFQFSLIALLSLIPGVFLVTYLHGRPGTKQIKNIERIALPINLLLTGLVLFLMFKGKDLGATTQSLELTNEEGVKIEREVVKSEFRKNILIFFFDNKTGDTALDWLQYGMVDMLEYKLFQDFYINSASGYSMYFQMVEAEYPDGVGVPLSLKQQFAERFHKNYFLTGSFEIIDGKYVVGYQLYKSSSGKKVAEGSYENSDVFLIIDNLEAQLKIDLELPAKHIEETLNLPISDTYTNSLEAVKQLVVGRKAWVFHNDYEKMLHHEKMALELDPTFAMAWVFYLNGTVSGNHRKEMEEGFEQIMKYLHKLPEIIQFEVRSGYYGLYKVDNEKAFSVIKMWRDLYPEDISAHQRVAQHWMQKGNYQKMIESMKKIYELDPGRPEYLLEISDSYILLGDHDKAYQYLEMYAERFPNSIRTFKRMGSFFRRSGELEKAVENYEDALLIDPSDFNSRLRLVGLEFAMGEVESVDQQYIDLLSACKSVDDSADVYGALSLFYQITGQIEKCIDTKEKEFAAQVKYLMPIQVYITKAVSLGLYSLAGRPEDGLAQIEDIRSHLIPPYDRFASLGNVSVYLELDNIDSLKSAIIPVEQIIADMKFDLMQNFVNLAHARIEELEGDFEEAADYYINIRELEPGAFGIDTKVGRNLRKAGKYKEAEKNLKEALELAPADPEANLELAHLYHEKGDQEKAMEYLEITLRAYENADPGYRYAVEAEELNKGLGRSGTEL